MPYLESQTPHSKDSGLLRSTRHSLLILPLLTILLAVCLLGGCASEGSSSRISTPDGETNGQFLHFALSVNPNGQIDLDNNGYYAILLNSQGETIEVTDLDTFTDFIRFDGINFDWYTRQANLPNPGFTFIQVGSLANQGGLSSDNTRLDIVFDINDTTSFINQYIASTTFSAQLITTDTYQGAYLGRVLDCMGPSLSFNSQQTVMAHKLRGAISPLPSIYPDDSLNDWITRDDLASDFPYNNFDIATFEIYSGTR